MIGQHMHTWLAHRQRHPSFLTLLCGVWLSTYMAPVCCVQRCMLLVPQSGVLGGVVQKALWFCMGVFLLGFDQCVAQHCTLPGVFSCL